MINNNLLGKRIHHNYDAEFSIKYGANDIKDVKPKTLKRVFGTKTPEPLNQA